MLKRNRDIQKMTTCLNCKAVHSYEVIFMARKHTFPTKLEGARFRILNEVLYTSPAEESLKMFNDDPELMNEYHSGFREQVASKWPKNPLDNIITFLRKKKTVKKIGDFGCGEARLAKELKSEGNGVIKMTHIWCLKTRRPRQIFELNYRKVLRLGRIKTSYHVPIVFKFR